MSGNKNCCIFWRLQSISSIHTAKSIGFCWVFNRRNHIQQNGRRWTGHFSRCCPSIYQIVSLYISPSINISDSRFLPLSSWPTASSMRTGFDATMQCFRSWGIRLGQQRSRFYREAEFGFLRCFDVKRRITTFTFRGTRVNMKSVGGGRW